MTIQIVLQIIEQLSMIGTFKDAVMLFEQSVPGGLEHSKLKNERHQSIGG
jgi:hypothetical protein